MEENTLGGKQINVLYLFSGADRPSSLAAQLEAMGKKWGTQVNIEMVDIVRSEAHDLSKEEVRESFRRRLRAGEFEAVIITAVLYMDKGANGELHGVPDQ